MSALIILVVLAAVLFFMLKAVKASQISDGGDWPLYAKRPMSMREQELYWKLLKALPEHIVLSQVALSQLVGVKKGNKAQPLRNRFDRKVADFVVCGKDASIVVVIELDDATHEREDRKTADATKDKVIKSAGIRVLRWHAKALPDYEQIQRDVLMPSQPSLLKVSAAKQ